MESISSRLDKSDPYVECNETKLKYSLDSHNTHLHGKLWNTLFK